MRCLLVLTVLTGCTASAVTPTCLNLPSIREVRIRSVQRVACVTFTIESGHATQLQAEQSGDLEFRASHAGSDFLVDGFEFGKETLTFSEAGRYEITVRRVDASSEPWSLLMSRGPIPLPLAERWQQAEKLATAAKRSRKNAAEAISLWKDLDARSQLGRALSQQADTLHMADPERARSGYEEALRICAEARDLRCTAEAATNNGVVSTRLADFERAFERLSQGAESFRRLALPASEGLALSGLGLLLRQAGDPEAVVTLTAAGRLLRTRDKPAYARVLNNLGLYYQSFGEHDRAVAHFRSALAIFESTRESAVRVRLNLGRSYVLRGEDERAQAILEGALSEAVRTSYTAGRADALHNLGQALLRQGRNEQARQRLVESLEFHRQVRSRRGESIALHWLGIESRDRGDFEEARRHLAEAARIRRESGLRDDASESVYALAQLEYRAGNLTAAERLAGEAITLVEAIRSKVPRASQRAGYYARKRQMFDLLTDIAMSGPAPADSPRGFVVSEQAHGRAHLDLLSTGKISGEIPTELLNRQSSLRRRIQSLSARLTEPDPPRAGAEARKKLDREREDVRQRIELLLGEEQEVDAAIRRAAGKTALGRPLRSVAELQSSLPADVAVLEFYLGERQSYAWLVGPSSVQSFRLPRRGDIEPVASRMANRFGAMLERRRSPAAQAAFQADRRKLAAMLLGPLAGVALPPRLILVLDGVLHRVPVEALRIPGAPRALGLECETIHMPSAAFLLAAKPPRPPAELRRRILAVADPVFDGDDARLTVAPAAPIRRSGLGRLLFAAELEKLKTLAPASGLRILQGFDASVPALQRMNLADYGVLHFSTHALIDDRIPELSRLTLSLVNRNGRAIDGFLYPHQLADFRLDRSVVVLSSCDAALGKEVLGEGLAGFSESLFSAGASQLVLATTKVDAEVSSAFFAEVYSRLWERGARGMEQAVTEARRAMARSERWSDPYYWASYKVVGAPSGGAAR